MFFQNPAEVWGQSLKKKPPSRWRIPSNLSYSLLGQGPNHGCLVQWHQRAIHLSPAVEKSATLKWQLLLWPQTDVAEVCNFGPSQWPTLQRVTVSQACEYGNSGAIYAIQSV